MLAGYSYTPKIITNHIHLGAVPASGSPTMGPYGEPPYRFGHVQKRSPVFSYSSEFVRAWDGTPHDHVLKSGSGAPLIFKDMRYEIRVDPEGFELLTALYKRRVYLIDNFHCNETDDHTPFVKQFFFEEFSYDSNLDPMLVHQIVNVLFLDMNTVAGL